MVIMLLFAVAAAKIKKYRILPTFRDKSLIGFAIVEICYIILQINVFAGNYNVVAYAEYVKKIYFFVLLIPIIVHRLYTPAIVGSGAVLAGTVMNRLVIAANGGKMPVYPTLSKLTGYFNTSVLGTADTLHSLGDSATKLKFLTDYIDLGYSILSVGDVLIHSFTFLIIYFTIKSNSIKESRS